MNFAPINGYKLAYSLQGALDRPAVVLSHALATSMDIWGYQLPLLARRFLVLRYDLRGHGESGTPGDSYTLQELASDVSALLDYLKISRAVFVGLSVGGMIGQTFALQYPEKLTGLVLCSTGSRTEPQAKATIEDRINRVRTEGLGSQVPSTLQRWFTSRFIEQAPHTMRWVSDLILATSTDGYIGCSRAIQGLDATDGLSEIRVRTLLIPGEHDLGFPETTSRTIQDKIANSELVVLKGAAHLGNVEQAHLFNEILVDFLGRVPG
ncbi:MAG: alpha/beta fold hydrolase [Verrucomicrobia bacterium]|nr:alpha/beta fold hydrolase [Verrucomicrobiota bacterium]